MIIIGQTLKLQAYRVLELKCLMNEAKTSIFTDNDLTHITDDYFEINLA